MLSTISISAKKKKILVNVLYILMQKKKKKTTGKTCVNLALFIKKLPHY